MLRLAKKGVQRVLRDVDHSHGYDHAIAVYEHTMKALRYENLDLTTCIEVMLAALLHDVDDRKFFPNNRNFDNARAILDVCKGHASINVDNVIAMIGLVSAFKNGNDAVDVPRYMLIPRYCDRLEAMGKSGIERCIEYSHFVKRPVYTSSTPRVRSLAELDAVAKPRFEQYRQRGTSLSAVDHMYDKIYHLYTITGNPYIDSMMNARHQELVDYLIKGSYIHEHPLV